MESGSRSGGGRDGRGDPAGLPDGHEASAPIASRALLTPGPLAPLSHLGVTLLRHVAATGLRYSLYQLGLPMPEAPPVRIVRLRLYLDEGKLGALLAGAPGGEAVAQALVDPGGAGGIEDRGGLARAARGLASTFAFHRARLRLVPRRLPRRLAAAPAGAPPADALSAFETGVDHVLRATNDALLADLVASLDRRARRARLARRGNGSAAPPAITPAAHRFLSGQAPHRGADLARFGAPDLRAPSWAERPDLAAAARRALEGWPLPPVDSLRGRFRETYRAALTLLAPLVRALAEGATARGLLDAPDDAFFLPFDLLGDLACEHRLTWMEAAVAANRAEHDSLRKAAEPLEILATGQETTPDAGERAEWDLAPLLPLP
ncbi:MAG TPA: hypothetical protein VIH93_07520 [Thermoanaerobaculia bacterium]